MYWMKNQSRQENLIYLAVWGMVFAAPLLSVYMHTINDSEATFDWLEIFFVWRKFAVFLLLFLIHNFLLAPLLVYKHRRWLYLSIAVVVLVGFTLYQCNTRPAGWQHKEPFPKMMERFDKRPPLMDEDEDFPPDHSPFNDMPMEKPMEKHHTPPPIVGERDILAVVVLILMFGANIGSKYYFRSRRDQHKLRELEKQNLEQQLEYLKYQINPHFFMNTLNNIHALVDIDPQKAQETILELSKMMRFVLYEGDKSGVPLSKEFEFIRTYIKLMQLRYTDKVKITIDVPTEAPDRTIPPLMLISFIENAFKHGISYQHDSFVDVRAELKNNELLFTCRNSKAEKPNQEKGGVGLANVKKRLDLLYDNNYTLQIKDEPDIYFVELKLPL